MPDCRRAFRPRLLAFLLTLPGLASGADRPTADWSSRVDPFIGTGGHGHTYPGATLPFGMVQLSPDTRLEGWDGCSGYHWTDDVVYGFSHTHLSGTGVSDYGDILFMPFTGPVRFHNGASTAAEASATSTPGYSSHFDKASERASPGWYAVRLTDSGVDVELTATERAGMHRYRFPEDEPAHVIVDLAHRDPVVDSGLRIVSPTGIEGWRRSRAWAQDQVVYFAARFSRAFTASVLAADDRAVPEALNELEGTNVKGVFSFGTAGGEILVKVGISGVDLEGAHRNLDAEIPGWNFAAVRYAARLAWNEALGRIEVQGGTAEQSTIFYTALYHSLLTPNLFSDVDGRYRGMDGQIHTAEGRRQYTVFSLWDTFRAAHPLYTLVAPERVGEFIDTFLAQAEQGGRLPVWELAANETDCMIGYHSVSVIADAWRKGFHFDAARALDAMVHTATLDHFGLDATKRQGFIGSDDASDSVSRTLEYAYDDWCIAQLAADLGRDDLFATFFRRSQAWRHLLDPATRFLRPRRNQRWLTPFDPRRVDMNYTEANAWQYSFFVPHDIHGLMAAIGGREAFVARLDSLFAADSSTTGRDQADITGRIGQYAHGNEPSHHMAWLYHYAGNPEKSAVHVRQILDTLYGPGADGLCGNEDCGQMSSWYVLSAIGLYPVCPGSNEYLIGAPLFEETVLHLPEDRRFVIRAAGATAGRHFVASARLNGKPLERSYLRHEEILRGRGLNLDLAASPTSDWGHALAARPDPVGAMRQARLGASRDEQSALEDQLEDRDYDERHDTEHARDLNLGADRILPAPFVRADADLFGDSLLVTMGCGERGADVYFARADPSRPASPRPRLAWQRYLQPLELRQSTRLRLVAERDGRRSPEVEAVFHRLPHDWDVQVAHEPNPQYTAGGPVALIDGLRGAADWRLGGWHGIQGEDFVATVDLRKVQTLRRVGASFLQDAGSWIWMPRAVTVAVSQDGKRFRQVARLVPDVPDDRSGVVQRDLDARIENVKARYVRITATRYGTIPAWHPGHGGQGFIFVDELLIE